MKIKMIILLLSIINFNIINSQGHEPFKSGEWLEYKISYSGWLKAGEATISIKNDTIDNKELYHVVAIGKTIGPINWFFKVRDFRSSDWHGWFFCCFRSWCLRHTLQPCQYWLH